MPKVSSRMDMLLAAVIMFIAVLTLAVSIALLFPLDLGDKADPFFTPPNIKPDWYFLSIYELFKHVPDYLGITISCMLALGTFLLPFLDRSKARNPKERLIVLAIGAFILIGILVFSVWGYVSQ